MEMITTMDAKKAELIKEEISKTEKVRDIMSVLTILFLTGVIAIFSVLIYDKVMQIKSGGTQTVVYQQSVFEEEQTDLTVNF